jgi:hypothetical protein
MAKSPSLGTPPVLKYYARTVINGGATMVIMLDPDIEAALNARLVAVCHVHSVTHVLTFNVSHFAGMAGFGPGIVAVDPGTV